MAPPFRRETDASVFILSRGLKSTNRRFVLRRPDHFPNGVVSTIVSFGHFSSCPYCRAHVSTRANANPFILGGGPQGNDAFLYSLSPVEYLSFFEWTTGPLRWAQYRNEQRSFSQMHDCDSRDLRRLGDLEVFDHAGCG